MFLKTLSFKGSEDRSIDMTSFELEGFCKGGGN